MVAKQRSGGRSARVQQAVFDAVFANLVEVGWANLSIAAIAAQAGVHETSIYRRWKTKEALVAGTVLERMGELLPVPDTGSLRTDLVAMLRGLLVFLRSPLGGALVHMLGALAPGEDALAFRQTFWASRFPVLLVPLTRGLERGELPPGTNRQLVLETLIGFFYLRVFVTVDMPDEELPEALVSLVLDGALHAHRAAKDL